MRNHYHCCYARLQQQQSLCPIFRVSPFPGSPTAVSRLLVVYSCPFPWADLNMHQTPRWIRPGNDLLKNETPNCNFHGWDLFGAPCVFLSASVSMWEGTGTWKGEDRLNLLSHSVDLYWNKRIRESWHKALCYIHNCNIQTEWIIAALTWALESQHLALS